jgi:hypothetical protein
VGLYERDGELHRFTGLQLIALRGPKIGTVTAWMDGTLADRFHLPMTISQSG